MQSRFKDKVVLITGGGRGMGKAIAESFAAEGAAVVISARTASFGEDTVAALRAKGCKASLVVGDISNRGDVATLMETAGREHGVIDVLIHCASDNAHGAIADMPDETFDAMVRTNIQSLFWIAKDAAPHLSKAKDKGRLIYISSGSANRTFMPGLIPYMASKAFMNAFARGLAVEFGQRNILVNVIEPGMIASDRMKEMLTPDQYNAMASIFPVPRVGESSDIAAAALFMASPDASYITGSSLLVDGGATMVPLVGLSKELSGH